jgi:hypothetical protein
MSLPPTSQGIRRARATLDQVPAAYHRGLAVLAESQADPSIPSSLGDALRTGKPTSRPPGGTDTELRRMLVIATQRLALCHRTLVAGLDWPHGPAPWEPDGIAFTVERGTTSVWFGSALGPRFLDPSDITTRLLSHDEVSSGVRLCKGLLGALEAIVWPDELTQRERHDRWIIREALAAVDDVRASLHTVWSHPGPADDERCRHAPACHQLREPDRRECQDCRKGQPACALLHERYRGRECVGCRKRRERREEQERKRPRAS